MSSEVLIIGGGVIGLSLARELHKNGVQNITIVDRGDIGREASWAAAGMLAPNIEAGQSGDFHRFCTESLALYPDLAADLLSETGIDIELDMTGTLSIAFDDTDEAELEPHVARGFQKLSGSEILDLEPKVSSRVRSGVLFPNDWQVENRKLLRALRHSVENRGVRIVENTSVSSILTDREIVTGVSTSAGDLPADVTVIATGAWTSLIKIGGTEISVRVSPIRGQMMSVAHAQRSLRHVIFSPRGYLVPRADGRVLIGATVEKVGFDKQTTDEGLSGLVDAAVEIVPDLSGREIAERWAGLRPYSADGFPILGDLPGYQNAFIATAHYRNGILLAPKTAEIMAQNILRTSRSEHLERYSARRFTSAANAHIAN